MLNKLVDTVHINLQ